MRGRVHVFETDLWLAAPIERVFAFFADAANLDAITPPWLRFSIKTPPPIPIALDVGVLIDYRLSLHGVPISWRTRIAEWSPPARFVDEQVRGPYRLWRHTHTFEALDGGTVCRDRVEYAHAGGAVVHTLLVRPDIERIFRYRQDRLAEMFGTTPVRSWVGERSRRVRVDARD